MAFATSGHWYIEVLIFSDQKCYLSQNRRRQLYLLWQYYLAILKAAIKLVAYVITITLLSILVYILYKFVVSDSYQEQQ